jgi:leucyl-tRNA synthetase
MMKLSLGQYPAAIAQAAEIANELDFQIAEVKHHIARLEGNADMVVAFEANLKNDNQRKARRFEVLQVNPEYQRAMDALTRISTEKANAVARLEHLRNEFSVAKLEARLAIAQKLIGLDSRELVGL